MLIYVREFGYVHNAMRPPEVERTLPEGSPQHAELERAAYNGTLIGGPCKGTDDGGRKVDSTIAYVQNTGRTWRFWLVEPLITLDAGGALPPADA